MKNKKTILIILSIGLFFAMPVFANSNLTIDFEDDPLFDEVNFLPGESITRWAKVVNNSGQTERIAVEAINVNDPNGFGNALTLEIKEGDNRLYNGSLSQFFNTGEVYLSDLSGGGNQTRYDFSITFYPGANDNFQGKTLGFDILIGFQGTGGGLAPGGGGGGGGFLPPGLTIYEPVKVVPTSISATIFWETSYEATSRVVYSTTAGQFDLSVGEPNYGYDQHTDEDPAKVINHLVTLTDLTVGTTYYYRSISHGSFALSIEHSFTTLTEEDIIVEEEDPVITDTGDKEKQIAQVIIKGVSDIVEDEESEESEEDTKNDEEYVEEDSSSLSTKGFLASIGDLFKSTNLYLLLFILIIILLIISLLSIDKKNKQKKRWWIFNFAILVLIILYYFICTFSLYRWIAILILILLIILSLLFKKKEAESTIPPPLPPELMI